LRMSARNALVAKLNVSELVVDRVDAQQGEINTLPVFVDCRLSVLN
jgi:hypothetical protein